MNARELIADVLNGEALQWLNGREELLPVADATLAAMPEIVRAMVVPLVWEGDDGEWIAKSGYGHYEISCNDKRVEFLIGYGSLSMVRLWRNDNLGYDLEAAKADANTHNAAQIMKGLGITPPPP